MTKEEFRSSLIERIQSLDYLLKFPIVARDAFAGVDNIRLDIVRIRQIQKWFRLQLGADAQNVKIYAKADNGKNLQKFGSTNLVFEAAHYTYNIPIVLQKDFYDGQTRIPYYTISAEYLIDYMENTMYAELTKERKGCVGCMKNLSKYLVIIEETEKRIAECVESVPDIVCPEFIVKHKIAFDDDTFGQKADGSLLEILSGRA